MRVVVFGNSVALNVRPPRQDHKDGTYVDLLRVALQSAWPHADVVNLAAPNRMVIHEGATEFEGTLQALNPDLVILHYGINEAAPRALPFRLWMLVHGGGPHGKVHRWLSMVIRILSAKAIGLFHLGGWVGPARFGKHLRRLIGQVRKETAGRVLVVNLGVPNDTYRRLLPRVERLVPRYNEEILRLAEELDVPVIDAYGMVSRHGVERVQPDGAHFSAEGHRHMFHMVWERMKQWALTPDSSGRGGAAT